MLGKYSPTVSFAYSHDQKWFEKHSIDGFYDTDGYDSYGYNQKNVDRAGNNEFEYASDPELFEDVLTKYGGNLLF